MSDDDDEGDGEATPGDGMRGGARSGHGAGVAVGLVLYVAIDAMTQREQPPGS